MAKQKPVFGPERPPESQPSAHEIPSIPPQFFHQVWMPLVEKQLARAGGIEVVFKQNPLLRELAQKLLNERGLEISGWVKQNCPVEEKSATQIVDSFQQRINASEEETPLAGEDSEESSDG